jgi:hypothetical protein
MEPCSTYKPWHDKGTGKTYLRPNDGKCVHYYFYFIDEQLGLCYLRVPTWCPFRLQVYCNGHFWLAAELRKRKIFYRLADNAFAALGNLTQAQGIADNMQVKALHRKLEAFVRRYCPAIDPLVCGEYCIRGVSNKAIRKRFPDKNSAQVSRMLKRLRNHGMIKKVGRTYHYYLTRLGRTVAIAGTKLKELVLIPAASLG